MRVRDANRRSPMLRRCKFNSFQESAVGYISVLRSRLTFGRNAGQKLAKNSVCQQSGQPRKTSSSIGALQSSFSRTKPEPMMFPALFLQWRAIFASPCSEKQARRSRRDHTAMISIPRNNLLLSPRTRSPEFYPSNIINQHILA